MAVPHNRRRLHVVLPGAPLHEIDERVGKGRRSEFIREVAEEKLTRLRRVESFEQVVGLVADGEIPEWEMPEAVAQWVHDLRYVRKV